MNLCPHEDDPLCCPPCLNARGATAAAPTVKKSKSFPAQYEGRCESGDFISVGDRIVAVAEDGDVSYRHVDCE